MADCVSLPNAAELVEELKDCADCAGGYCTEACGNFLFTVVSAIEQLLAENAKLKAERDAAVEAVEELNDDFVECVCSGYGNLSPYCGNRCAECVDKRGWCKEVTKHCRGFIPMAYKDWRGVQKEEEA